MKNKFIFISIVVLLLFTNIKAQNGIISGFIVDSATKTGMNYVAISLNNNYVAYSNHKGEFTFENLSPGEYKLYVSFIGYEPKTISNIKIENNTAVVNLDIIELKTRHIQIPEICIFSSSSNSNYSESFIGSNIAIKKAELEKIQPIGTEEILKKAAGVNVSGDMGLSNRLNIGIRGSYPRRAQNILLLEDGTPIAPAPYLAPEAYYNPPTDRLDGIEIIKGADVLTMGSNTMYGVVNYITKRPPLKPTLGINLTSGENGYHSQFITYGGTWNNLGAELQVLNKLFDGFQQNSQMHIFNTTAKVYADLGKKSSVYLKLNYHQENSKASYSSLTPFTFRVDPKINPFDADDLATKRFAADMIYNTELSKNTYLSSKVYATQFQRDWWRQENTLVKASAVKSYVGENIYSQRYSYLDGLTTETNDWVRVGKVINGRESTKARNRLFRVGGIQETLKANWKTGELTNKFEAGVRYHVESFNDVEFLNDSSRFSRSGKLIKDDKYTLSASSVYIKNTFKYKEFSIAPALRYEVVVMRSFNLMKIALSPDNDGSKYFGSIKNTFRSLLPGIGANYNIIHNEKHKVTTYAGIYKGYNAPTSGVGFLKVEDGIVSTPAANETINMKPETSLNYEAGVRGSLYKELFFQTTYFSNNITNFYSAGRNEAFQTLGSVSINGVEFTANADILKMMESEKHGLNLEASVTVMNSKITGGVLTDSDVLNAKHTDATKEELINKINGERNGFEVYFANDSLITREITTADFSSIKKLKYNFGENGIKNNAAPYIPNYIMNYAITYSYKEFKIGAAINIVGSQYTDYLNFSNETAEGAIGKLTAFKTIDVNTSYTFSESKNKYLKCMSLFIAGKNITNEVYKASRLHRVSSGIMPGGFRQINAGIKFNI